MYVPRKLWFFAVVVPLGGGGGGFVVVCSKNGPFPASFSLFSSFQYTVDSKQNVQYTNEFLPMTGYEPQTFGIGSDRSTNWATTTALVVVCYSPPLLSLIYFWMQAALGRLEQLELHRGSKYRKKIENLYGMWSQLHGFWHTQIHTNGYWHMETCSCRSSIPLQDPGRITIQFNELMY